MSTDDATQIAETVSSQNGSSLESQQAIATLQSLIHLAYKGGASDIIIQGDHAPQFKHHGELVTLKEVFNLQPAVLEQMVYAITKSHHKEKLANLSDIDLGYMTPKGIRSRVNIFHERGRFSLVLRIISQEVPSLEQLGMAGGVLPEVLNQPRGLVIVTGATGTGKSTTLAACIDYINQNHGSHIITLEDPIEYYHKNKKSTVTQREIGIDTISYPVALRSALRQAPNVIFVGELRDAETMEVALQAADTGHLVLTTMHTNDATDAMIRLFATLGPTREGIVRKQLAENLKLIISQRLVKKKDKKGMACVQEILVNTSTIKEQIMKGTHPNILRDFIEQGQMYGMQTFDQHLFYLYENEIISYEEAYQYATSKENFDLLRRGILKGT